MAASSSGRGRAVGDYLVGRQIGSGSFSVVWHGRHRVHGTEVAIKEIATSRLNKKLQESLMSEIFILKRINHPNIISLHDIIEAPGRIHIVLEYCKGGDLSMYLQRHGKVSEASARNFMRQLAAGLLVLQDNNLIHRDLKPQNLLLSTNDKDAVLKIADFGFARSLQPRGLAETLCGSPLYMAPEIMQLQKYDAKADLWSVGAILFQLVIGTTPFIGNNQIQLLQNIVKSIELQFPDDSKDLSFECKDLCHKLLRRNPVERLTFDEFFNHPFVSRKTVDPLRSRMSSRLVGGFALPESSPPRNAEENIQEDCLPFFLDDDSNGPEGSPSFSNRRSSMKSSYGFSVDTKSSAREPISKALNSLDFMTRQNSAQSNMDNSRVRNGKYKLIDDNLTKVPNSMDQRMLKSRSRESLEMIGQDYVLVSSPPLDASSSSVSSSRPSHTTYKPQRSLQSSVNLNASPSAPMPMMGAVSSNDFCIDSSESPGSAPGTSQGSMDMGDAFEQPSPDGMTRIKSLQQFASMISDLVHEKIVADKQLEAFSIQLVILAIWKQALHICHAQAASASEGSPSQEGMRLRSSYKKHSTSYTEECPDVGTGSPDTGTGSILSQIEREFLREVEHAEELVKVIEPGGKEMPDPMEMIFQSALSLGRNGGVDELMGNMENASDQYSKAVRLLLFLLVEASSLILSPPFSLTSSDRYRLRTYIDILHNRQGHSRSQRLQLLKCEGQEFTP